MIVISVTKQNGLVLGLEAGPVFVSIRSIRDEGSIEIEIEAPRTIPIHRGEVFDAIFGDPIDDNPLEG